MNLIDQKFDNLTNLIAALPISFNPDIYETNVINLIILVGGIFYLGSSALSESLMERQQRILSTIQESEERLQQAIIRFTESEKQLTQTQLVIESINADADKTAKQVKTAILTEGKAEIERLTNMAKAQIDTVETKVRKQIANYVCKLALQRVTLQLEGKLGPNFQQDYINNNISKITELKNVSY